VSSLHYVHRCKARSLGRPWSANAEASSALVRGVFRASLSTAHLSPGSRGHRSAGSLLGAGIRVTGSRFLAWSSSVLRARLGGVPATRLLGCARSGSGLLACSAAAQPFNQPDTQRRATFARFGCFRSAVACRLSQTLGIAGMQMQASSNAQPHGSPMQEAVAPANEWAVRPLAASARPEWFVAGSVLCAEPALSSEENACWVAHSFLETKHPMLGKARVELCEVTACSMPIQAMRSSAKPNARGRAATSFARGGGFGLFSSSTTQRTMRAGCVPQRALPNPSIERTSPGKPGAASHLKR